MTIKIHGLAMSTCTGRVLYTLFEKDVEDFELVPVDLASGAHKKPEFLALQPFGQIPALEDDETKLTLFESRAIARYIVDKYPSKGTALFGKTLEEKALVNQWMEVEAQNFNPPISSAVFQLIFCTYRGLTTDESVVTAELEKLGKVLDVYEARLSKSKYLAGDCFSLADLSHVPYLHYLVNVAQRGDVVKSRKHVNAWWEDISSRPAWNKVLALAAPKS